MKKLLLLSAAAIIAGSATAGVLAGPVLIPYSPIQAVSPDGRYAIAAAYGDVIVYDLTTGNYAEYVTDGTSTQYDTGNMPYTVSNDNILVGSISDDQAAYLNIEAGNWAPLPKLEGGRNGAFAIAPDASFIVGYTQNNKTEGVGDDKIATVPAIWYANERGRFPEIKVLPYPTADITGRTPQRIMAMAISADGQVIAGQVIDCVGFFPEPIYWKKNDNGEWEYVRFAETYLNPMGIKFPEWHLMPPYPEVTDYMSAEEREAYNQAIADADEGIGTYPDYDQYMTDEELDRFEEDAIEYNKQLEKNRPWFDAYNQLIDEGPTFERNQIYCNGETLVGNIKRNEIGMDGEQKMIAAFNLKTGKVTQIANEPNLMATMISNDGTILAGREDEFYTYQAYVISNGSNIAVEMEKWLDKVNYEDVVWLKDNMTFDVVSYKEVENPETGLWEQEKEIIPNYLVTGMPITTPNMNLLAAYTNVTWDDPDPSLAFMSYAIPLDFNIAGIEEVGISETPAIGLAIERDGIVTVKGTASNLQVVDLQGRKIFETGKVTGSVATGAKNGIFIVKATDEAGRSVTCKAAF